MKHNMKEDLIQNLIPDTGLYNMVVKNWKKSISKYIDTYFGGHGYVYVSFQIYTMYKLDKDALIVPDIRDIQESNKIAKKLWDKWKVPYHHMLALFYKDGRLNWNKNKWKSPF